MLTSGGNINIGYSADASALGGESTRTFAKAEEVGT